MRHISITSLDVGYSLLTTGMVVALDEYIGSVQHDDGTITGTTTEIAEQLTKLGYRVTIAVTPPPGVQMRSPADPAIRADQYASYAALMRERDTCTDQRVDEIDSEILAMLTAIDSRT